MDDDLAPLDPAYVQDVVSKPPFVSVQGVVNLRDLGLYKTSFANQITKPRFALRSAEISAITDEGKSALKELGVTVIYDLRSDTEIINYNTPQPEIADIQMRHIPVFKIEDYSPEEMSKRFQLYSKCTTEAFMEIYSQILDNGGPAFGTLFRHVRDRPTEGFLFHCTAGKDRTGVLAALLLTLAGVSDEDIALDYALTRVGREPIREAVMTRLSKFPLFATDKRAALNMFTCRKETMHAFLDMLRTDYGGIEAYMKKYLEFSDEDIRTCRDNLLIPSGDARL